MRCYMYSYSIVHFSFRILSSAFCTWAVGFFAASVLAAYRQWAAIDDQLQNRVGILGDTKTVLAATAVSNAIVVTRKKFQGCTCIPLWI